MDEAKGGMTTSWARAEGIDDVGNAAMEWTLRGKTDLRCHPTPVGSIESLEVLIYPRQGSG